MLLPKNDLFRASGMIEIRHGAMGFIQNGIRCNAGRESAFVVGIAFQKILVYPLSDCIEIWVPPGLSKKTSGRLSEGNWFRMVDTLKFMELPPEINIRSGRNPLYP